jgi:hypothetical protein
MSSASCFSALIFHPRFRAVRPSALMTLPSKILGPGFTLHPIPLYLCPSP